MGYTCPQECGHFHRNWSGIYSLRGRYDYYVKGRPGVRCIRWRRRQGSIAIALLLLLMTSGCGIFHGADGSTALVIFPVSESEIREAPNQTDVGASQQQCLYKANEALKKKSRLSPYNNQFVRNIYFGVKNIHVGSCLHKVSSLVSDVRAGGDVTISMCPSRKFSGSDMAKLLPALQKVPQQTSATLDKADNP